MKIQNTSRLLMRKVQINSLESMDKTEEWLISTLKKWDTKI